MAKPFVKYAGGKTQLLPELTALLKKPIKNYFEPFVGGGALFFHLKSGNLIGGVSYLMDVNAELMAAYAAIKFKPEMLVKDLSAHEALYEKHPEEYYYHLRGYDPAKLSTVQSAARFIFLNKAGFNGLYRLNKSGKFNVPWGKKDVVRAFDRANIDECHQLLAAKTVLYYGDFQHVLERVKEGDTVYFDPPYLPKSETANFTAYSKDGFNEEDQCRLANVALQCVEKGAHVLISNADVPLAHDIFKNFKYHSVAASRAINSKGQKRGKVWEAIFEGGE